MSQPRLTQRLAQVEEAIGAAASRSGRDRTQVQLIAVTKGQPVEVVQLALEVGLQSFGENRVQEALPKIALWPKASWHLIGQLQRNKAARAAAAFSMIHSVGSVRLALALDQAAADGQRRLPVLLEVNVAQDESKGGVAPQSALELARTMSGLPHLSLEGLMTLAPRCQDPEQVRWVFTSLRRLRDSLAKELALELPELSMGMSADFAVAVEEGATMIRLGHALFGAVDG